MRDEWTRTTLGEICKLTKGATPTMKATPGPYPLIVTAAEPLTSDSFQFEGEAVCVPMVSSTGHGHASLKRVHYASGRFAVANIITALQRQPDVPLDMKYLWLLLDHGRDEIIVPLMKGTANVSLSQRALAAAQIVLPPLEEQRRIVDLIGALDDTIAAAERAASLADSAYVANGGRLQDAEGPCAALESLVRVARSGGTPSRKRPEFYGGSVPWVKSGEVAGEPICSTSETITDTALEGSSAWLVPEGAVLVAMYGATAAQVGRLGVPAATNQAVLALLPDEETVDSDYLYHLLRSDSDRLKALATGAAQPNLSKGVIVRQEYAVPSLDIQRRLAFEMNGLSEVAAATRRLSARLRILRSNLLTALLSGEHEIPESYDELMEATA